MSSKRDVLMAAISAGAPLYNAGRADACHDTYVKAAEYLIQSPGLVLPTEEAALRDAVTVSLRQLDRSEAAWTMRRAFDAVLGVKEWTLLDLQSGFPAEPRWLQLDDSIMGGVSTSTLVYDGAEQAVAFMGNVSTDRNGGFGSIRSKAWGGWACGQASGLRLACKGDGRVYKLNAKMDDSVDGVTYQQDFRPAAGVWTDVSLPFSSFLPNFRGRVAQRQPPLRGAALRQVGFMVSKFSDLGGVVPSFTPGRFRLDVKRVMGFR
ncbi:MAG: hypothetical protein WDW38_005107 [Sanguina aurantia]